MISNLNFTCNLITLISHIHKFQGIGCGQLWVTICLPTTICMYVCRYVGVYSHTGTNTHVFMFAHLYLYIYMF